MTDAPHPTPPPSPHSEDHPGAVLGPYTLVSLLGEGGFGSVWVAEQSQPVRRRVALKIVKAGMGSRDVLQRFEAERQALAVMDHPGIAKVLDAGTTPLGRPYFVMELVEGTRITSFADHATLSVRDRLALFVQVCHAVQHAHQKGIVHRDLKPDNVLAASDDGRPHARVIDFGIAKALETPLTDSTLQTGAHQIMGTPAYMAPEQALRSADVDTRADVYSLGAMLYELLCGARPFQFDSHGETTLSEVLRQIQEVDPRPPSTRVTEHEGDRLRGVPAWRGVSIERLTKSLRGDLDWIVQRALEKDRSRRYPTVAALSDDVERHLASEPIEASPPSRVYRVKKLVRRHRGATAGLLAATLALIGSIGALTWSVVRVADERDAAHQARQLEAEARVDAEQSRDAAHEAEALAETRREEAEDALDASREVTGYLADLLGSARPGDMGRDVTVREVLDRVAPSLGARFAERPTVEVELRKTVGTTYRELGAPAEARAHLQRAVELDTERLGPDHPDTLLSRQELALLDWMQSDLDSALEQMEHVHARLLELLGPQSQRRIEALNVLAIVWSERGELDRALDAWREVLAAHEARFGTENPATARALHNVGMVLSSLGRWTEAEEYLLAALDIEARLLGERHPDTLSTLADLANLLQQRGDWQRALPMEERLLEVRREVLGEEHPATLSSMVHLGTTYWWLGRHTEALALVSAAEPVARRVLGDHGDVTILAVEMLGNLHMETERYAEAEPLVLEALASNEAKYGPDHISTLISLQNLAALRSDQGRIAQAFELLNELVERCTRALGPDHDRTLRARYLVATSLTSQGAATVAEPKLRALLDDCLRVLGPDVPWTVDVKADLAWTLLDTADYEEAEELLYEVHEARTRSHGAEHEMTMNALEGLARLYRDTRRDAELTSVVRLLLAATRRRAESPDGTPWDFQQLSWYLQGEELPEARDVDESLLWAERANKATGYRVPRYLDVLSDARRSAGDLEGALEAQERSLDLMSGVDPMRGYHEERRDELRAEIQAADEG